MKTGDATEVDMGKKYPLCLYLSLPSQQALGDLEYMFVVVSALNRLVVLASFSPPSSSWI